LAKDLTKFCHI